MGPLRIYSLTKYCGHFWRRFFSAVPKGPDFGAAARVDVADVRADGRADGEWVVFTGLLSETFAYSTVSGVLVVIRGHCDERLDGRRRRRRVIIIRNLVDSTLMKPNPRTTVYGAVISRTLHINHSQPVRLPRKKRSRWPAWVKKRCRLRVTLPVANRFLPRDAMLARYMLWPCVC